MPGTLEAKSMCVLWPDIRYYVAIYTVAASGPMCVFSVQLYTYI